MPQQKLMFLLREKAKSGELSIEIIATSVSMEPYSLSRTGKKELTYYHVKLTYQGRSDTFDYYKWGTKEPDPHTVLASILEQDTIYPYGEKWGEWAEDLMIAGPDQDGNYHIAQIQTTWEAQKAYQTRLYELFRDDFRTFMETDKNWDANYDEDWDIKYEGVEFKPIKEGDEK